MSMIRQELSEEFLLHLQKLLVGPVHNDLLLSLFQKNNIYLNGSSYWPNCTITLKVTTTVFKVLSCSEPPYLRELLNAYNPTRCLRSSQKHLLTVPACRTSIASRAFSVTAPVLWNSIDIDLKQSDSVASFKRNIKTLAYLNHILVNWSCDDSTFCDSDMQHCLTFGV